MGNSQTSNSEQEETVDIKFDNNYEPSCNHNLIRNITDIFTPEQVLAEGGTGRVLLARHKKTKRQYAVKQMKRSHDNTSVFMQESSILPYLNHPNIISIDSSYVTANEYYYIATEYCSGGNLLDRVK